MAESESRSTRAARLRQLANSGRELELDQYRRRSRRSVLLGGLGAVAGALGWRWVQTQATDDRIPSVLRGALENNEGLWTALYDDGRRVPEYSLGDARPLRVNGRRGLDPEVDLAGWSLRVEGPNGQLFDELTLDDVRAVGEREVVMEHKCIEGWSNVTHWSGVDFAAFARPYLDRIGRAAYVAITTVDGRYYVGLDLESVMHPQVLLGTGLDGEPLDVDHGAPLRLVSPIHYGIKSIKQIGTIGFSRERPADFWAERGYDWHSQH